MLGGGTGTDEDDEERRAVRFDTKQNRRIKDMDWWESGEKGTKGMKEQAKKIRIKGIKVKGLLMVAALILFAIFVRNLEVLFHEIGGYQYQRELSSFEYSLREKNYSTLWREIKRQQALGIETMLDRGEFDALAEYYEAALWCYVLESQAQQGNRFEYRQKSLKEWEECREQAKGELSSYRFRKAAERIDQIYHP